MIVTGSEAEALHVEQSLVKRHRPPFNVRLRDDKSFPYIAVTVEDEFPRVMFTRERHRPGVLYFGPYANAKKVRETLDVLNRVFQFRPCEGPQPGRHSGVPCLDYHIDRCHAPCVGYIKAPEYREIIEGVTGFLSGDTQPIQRELEARMRDAAANERFEEAARYRNRLFSIRHLAERQAAEQRGVRDVDVIGIAMGGDRAAVQLFPLRDGRLVDRLAFHLENVEGQDLTDVFEAFCVEHYTTSPSIPRELDVPREIGDVSALEEFLTERRGSAVEVRKAERGEKRRLVDLAQQNATLALESDAFVAESRRQRRVEALEELREALNLESLPIRIECFDISTIQGQETVGSMVVFEDAVAKKAHYRKFGVRGLDGQDDFAAMAEVVSRRFARLEKPVSDPDYDDSFAAVPNLVVDRRRQGAAVGGAGGAAAVRPAADGRDRAREARRGGVRAGAGGVDRARPLVARAAAAPARPRRGAPVRARVPPAAARRAGGGVDLRHAPGRRSGAAAGAAAPLRLAGALPRREPRGARGRAGHPAEDGALDLRAAAQGRPRLATRSRTDMSRCLAPGRGPTGHASA